MQTSPVAVSPGRKTVLALRVLAVFFALLAISNLTKPLELSLEQGFVFFGRRLTGMPNLIAAWSFALFLAVYAAALWRERSHALPMGIAYAGYVTANLFFFFIRMAGGGRTMGLFGLAYAVLALALSWGAVVLMARAGFAGRDGVPGRLLLRSCALLFAVMALSNLLKTFAYTEGIGFVLLGQRLSGLPNVVFGLAFAAFLAAYAWTIWSERRVAVTLGAAYALYVLANLVLWNFRKPDGAETPLIFNIPYLVAAIGVSGGAALLLWRQRERLAR